MKDIDEQETFAKELNQLDTVDSSVDSTIKEMGALWKKVTTKLTTDKNCYLCKKDISDDKFTIVAVPDNKVDKGMCVFVSICQQCNQ